AHQRSIEKACMVREFCPYGDAGGARPFSLPLDYRSAADRPTIVPTTSELKTIYKLLPPIMFCKARKLGWSTKRRPGPFACCSLTPGTTSSWKTLGVV